MLRLRMSVGAPHQHFLLCHSFSHTNLKSPCAEQEGPSHATKIERQYFPERFGFDLFGDPFEHKRECVLSAHTLTGETTEGRRGHFALDGSALTICCRAVPCRGVPCCAVRWLAKV